MTAELAYNYEETTALISNFNQSDVDKLKEWTVNLDGKKCIPKNLSDKQLVLFYNACYGDIEKTKICIEKYYSTRKGAPDLFDNRKLNAKDIQVSINSLEFAVLPNQSPEGYDIVFHRLHDFDPAKYHLGPGIKMLMMTVDSCLYRRGPQNGIIFLFDNRGVKLSHLTRLSMSTLKTFLQYVQEAMPVRMKAIHVMNAVPFIDKILGLLKPFINKTLWNMIKIHTTSEDMEKFYREVLPKSCLPPDFGGDLPDTQTLHKKTLEEFKLLEDYFEAEEKQRKDAIPLKDASERDEYVERSFKRLELD